MRPGTTSLVLWLATALAGASGCDRLASLAQQASQASLFDGDNAVKAIGSLRQAAGASRTQCLEIAVYKDHAEIQLQDPAKPENADAYRYERGLTSGPIPVKLLGGGRLADHVFPLEELKLETLPALFAEAVKRTALEGGHVEELRVRREFSGMSAAARQALVDIRRRTGTGYVPAQDFPEGAIVMQLSVSGTRKNATVKADASGRIVTAKVL
jgi:hypothetical protein